MKVNDSPEKLYFDVNNNLIGLYDSAILGMFSAKNTETSIEYTRTDAFIEKTYNWLKNYAFVDDNKNVNLHTLLHDFLKDSRNF